jgi:hypothetical protein
MATTEGMVRIQIRLEDAQHRRLRALGAQSGKGLAEQVREAVGRYLIQQSHRTIPLEPVLGKFRPVAAKGLKAHDRDYADTRR